MGVSGGFGGRFVLEMDEGGVEASGVLDEVVVRADFHDLAVLEDGNEVGIADGGEAVGDYDGGTANGGFVQSLLDNAL